MVSGKSLLCVMYLKKKNKQIILICNIQALAQLIVNTTWTVSIILALLQKLRNKTDYYYTWPYIAIPWNDNEPADLHVNLVNRMLSSISLPQYCT